jgi:hypothetical protein
MVSPSIGVPTMTGRFVAVALDGGFARGPDGGKRHDIDAGTGHADALDGAIDQAPGQGVQPVMAFVMQMIGLGCGDQNTVDAAAEQEDSSEFVPGGSRRAHRSARVPDPARPPGRD